MTLVILVLMYLSFVANFLRTFAKFCCFLTEKIQEFRKEQTERQKHKRYRNRKSLMRSTKPSKEFMFFYGLRLNSPFYTTFLHFFNRPTDRLEKVDIEAQLTELTILTEQNRNKGNKNFLNRLSGYVWRTILHNHTLFELLL